MTVEKPIAQDYFNIPGVANYTENAGKTEISFMYNGNITLIMDKIHMLSLEDVLMEEPSLEEIFLHYYE